MHNIHDNKISFCKKLTIVLLIIITILGCGGSTHKKQRTAESAVPDILKSAGSEQQIRALLGIWRAASLTKVGIDNRIFGTQRSQGETVLKELKSVAARGPKELARALRDFKYRPDPIEGKLDTITQPWVTCIKKYGDCDDSAWLCAALMSGAIYDIMELRNGFKGGHLVFVSTRGDVFSNFELDGRIDDPRELGKKYNKRWTHIIKISSDIKVESIIQR